MNYKNQFQKGWFPNRLMATICNDKQLIKNYINEYIKISLDPDKDRFNSILETFIGLLDTAADDEFICFVSKAHIFQGFLLLHKSSNDSKCLLAAYNERAMRDLLLTLPDNLPATFYYNDPVYNELISEFITISEKVDLCTVKGEKSCNEGIKKIRQSLTGVSLIESKKDPVIQECKEYNSLKGRIDNNRFIVEGSLLVKRALKDGQLVEKVIYSGSNSPDFDEIISLCRHRSIPVYNTTPGIMSVATDTHPVPNIIAVVRLNVRGQSSFIISKYHNSILILDGVSNPDNLGMILRTADAGGISSIVLLSNSTHYLNKNAIRGGRGAVGKIPMYVTDDDFAFLKMLQENNFKIIGTSAKSPNESFYRTDYAYPNIAFVLGSESHGMRKEVIDFCTDFIRIPMAEGQSSLNVAVAAALVMYEYVRSFYQH